MLGLDGRSEVGMTAPCRRWVGHATPFAQGWSETLETLSVPTWVAAELALLGRRSWWFPAWLGRILPNVDIEGAQVRQDAGDARGSLRAA
jgi:uncharacterized membrane protein YdfJ with MMPL/SSD domain